MDESSLQENTPLLPESESLDTSKPGQLCGISPLAVGDQRLQRQIGWITASLINVSYMIGGGIFASPALTLSLVGSGGMNIVVWVFASLIALTGVATYAELGTMLPRSGGEKEYLAYIYRKPKLLLPYVFAFYEIIVIAAGIASQSTVFGRYLNVALFGMEASTPLLDRVWAVLVATLLHLVNIWSVNATLKSMVALTAIKISVLLLIILTGVLTLCGLLPSDVNFLENISFNGTSTSIAPYASAFYYCMHGYSGFNAIQYSLDEVKDPIKNLPKIAESALGLTAILYVLAIVSYMTVLSVEDIKKSELTVAASFFTKVFGDGFSSRVLPVLVGLSAVGCTASLTFSGGRLILETARDGLIPYGQTIGYVSPKYKSPINAMVLQYVLVVVYLIATPGAVYQFIIAFASWPAYIFFLLIGVGVFILRQREPALKRPYKAYSSFVVIFIIFSIYEILFVFVPVPSEDYPYWSPYAAAIVTMLASVGLWYYQVIVLDSPSNSYNKQILNQGREALAREVYA
ncbi:hypothetical protein K450DRAFT_242466 [Umbelopsis ramanniana AG]|uniref:Amino acid transporter n=1 Tax=Umbelopsis ramanniana AG TaxID=1314678 RepID=A0AAD5HE74_UMBRA|nr:uncharacterized protein K450DRAFT_242466 [Umbelopsis ramanniana AG]KAI8579271.1 hypothetical protein K450DRAFT_242466 [Umbelopsis ramanniana AG]